MKYLHPLCVTVLGLMSCFNPMAHGAVITINPSTDGHIRSSGSSFTSDAILVGRTDTAGDFLNGVFAFDLSAVPNGMQVDSVSLTLYSATTDSSSADAPVTFNLYELLHDVSDSTTWTEYSPGNNCPFAVSSG